MDRRSFLKVATLSPAAALALNTAVGAPALAAGATHTFGFAADGSAFLLDGKPFQIRSGEIHSARVPVEHWRHRIQMAKALGLNTIGLYDFWNYHEVAPGTFDFSTERRNIAEFIRIAQDEGMWVLLRPGPYVCAEWDLGGIPARVLADVNAKIRVRTAEYPRHMTAFRRYATALAEQVRPLLITNGGPILMCQVENEYGSFAGDQRYLQEIQRVWAGNGINVPFYTEDGLGQLQANRTNIPGGAIALSGGDANTIANCRRQFPDVPAMSGELYSGWLTHWGHRTFASGTVTSQLTGLMARGLSFNLYMFHGGTSFGYWSGANAANDGSGYQPDITSYDYGSPVSEQGVATELYPTYRQIIASALGTTLPAVPAAPPVITPEPVTPNRYASLWDNLPRPVRTGAARPQPMEMHGQDFGLVLYRSTLPGSAAGELTVDAVHDYATVFVDASYQGGYTRVPLGAAVAQPLRLVNGNGPLPLTTHAAGARLDVLVEGMGRVNYGHAIDRKGITSSVRFAPDGEAAAELSEWSTYPLPLDERWWKALQPKVSDAARPGQVFRAELTLDELGDTYLDMSGWTKGLVFVNGHNLGRYWKIGPQLALFCPVGFLVKGRNVIDVVDLHQTEAAAIGFVAALGDVQPPSQGGTTYAVKHVASGKVLGIAGDSATAGAYAELATESGAAAQQWDAVPNGTGYVSLINRHSGLALDNFNHSMQPGNRLGQWDDTGGANQQWELTRGGDFTYTIRNRESGLYVAALGTADGSPVTQEQLSGTSTQWRLDEV
ncbi:beta-galactosidase [Nakamurella aerolata]|uniref:Beta-galactosidase n=1 Tax=Nakamurella aerolata TaxID=1656892 RepID=A0A849ABL0_9ACTN|nr:beta-galactosidase [Nakamurella aerolata]NNG35870.1 beta-galactosidase [Nakamurella aerolata]